MNGLGVNAFHGDASAALLRGGEVVAAIEEERLNRIKHWAGLPSRSIAWCLAQEDRRDLGYVAISRDPKAKMAAKLLRALQRPMALGNLGSRAANAVRVARFSEDLIRLGLSLDGVQLHYVEHHRSHLASAFFCSPYEEAAVVSVDGFGDYSSAMWAVGSGSRMDVRGSVSFPHSLGLFYTAFTQFLGFPHYGDEYKMMGLAAYGEPRLAGKVRQVVAADGGQIRLNLDFFTHHTHGVDMNWDDGQPSIGAVYSPRIVEVFGQPRKPQSEIGQQHMDLAASVQTVLEECYFALLNHVHRQTGLKRLCLAGGVALNCAANGKIWDQTPFEEVYIQAASHDAGTSIGAALYVWHQVLGQPRRHVMRHAYLGPEYSDDEILAELETTGARYHRLSEDDLLDRTARALADGCVTGWFQGRMEFGPRALGSRSILADPRRPDMKDILNRRIKHREPFRPFCPSVLAHATGEYFEISHPSPFMVQAYPIRPEQRGRIPAVTHQDGTGRLQTVERDAHPRYWKLIERFGRITGIPVLINTSFNENEPIVNTPAQAVDCFLRTKMDALAVGSFLLLKSENAQRAQHRQAFAHAQLTAGG
jgi:carbamoyltransferase